MPLTRRHVAALAGIAALGVVATGATWQIAQGQQSPSSEPGGQGGDPAPRGKTGLLRPGTRVLFQGDSVTDARRDRKNSAANRRQALGEGYAWLVASDALVSRPDDGLEFLNRGISGNVTADLLDRWQEDTVALAPDVVSILVGINDYWNRHRVKGFVGSADTYHRELGAVVDRTRAALPDASIVICEPFVLRADPVTDQWLHEFADYQRAAADLAAVNEVAFVAFQSLLDEAAEVEPATTWLHDGIHPTADGAALLAGEWARVATAS